MLDLSVDLCVLGHTKSFFYLFIFYYGSVIENEWSDKLSMKALITIVFEFSFFIILIIFLTIILIIIVAPQIHQITDEWICDIRVTAV